METHKRVHLQTVKTQMKCSIMLHIILCPIKVTLGLYGLSYLGYKRYISVIIFSFPGAGRKKRVFLDDIANAFNRLPNEVKFIFPGEYELDIASQSHVPVLTIYKV